MTKKKRKYKMYGPINGRKIRLEITRKACKPFGFYVGDEILTPRNTKAIVVGVRNFFSEEKYLWIKAEDNDGITFMKKERIGQYKLLKSA
jgi:hypothetical protein